MRKSGGSGTATWGRSARAPARGWARCRRRGRRGGLTPRHTGSSRFVTRRPLGRRGSSSGAGAPPVLLLGCRPCSSGGYEMWAADRVAEVAVRWRRRTWHLQIKQIANLIRVAFPFGLWALACWNIYGRNGTW
jgi:hypothetical protein